MGDSGLCFRLRWAVRVDRAAPGAGSCGEWPGEVAALSTAIGQCSGGTTPRSARRHASARGRAWIEVPVIALPSHMDLGVIFGCEDEGATLLVSDCWASDYPERRPITDMQQIGCFLDRVQAPEPRARAVRAGLRLAVSRFREGLVGPNRSPARVTTTAAPASNAGWTISSACRSCLEQQPNLFTSAVGPSASLHRARTKYAPPVPAPRSSSHRRYRFDSCWRPLSSAIASKLVLGSWDPSDPIFGMVKQQPLAAWTPDVRQRRIEPLAGGPRARRTGHFYQPSSALSSASAASSAGASVNGEPPRVRRARATCAAGNGAVEAATNGARPRDRLEGVEHASSRSPLKGQYRRTPTPS